MGYITMIVIASLFALLLRRSFKNKNVKITKKNYQYRRREYSETNEGIDNKNEIKQFNEIKKIKILDILGIASFVLMGFSAIFLIFDPIQASSSRVNATALVIITMWTIFVLFIEGSLICIKKENIPI